MGGKDSEVNFCRARLTDEVQFRLATEQSCHKLKLRAHIVMYVCAQRLSISGNIFTTSLQ